MGTSKDVEVEDSCSMTANVKEINSERYEYPVKAYEASMYQCYISNFSSNTLTTLPMLKGSAQ